MRSRGVLLVEDDPGLLGVLSQSFRRAGFFVRTACDEQSAIAEIASMPPAAIVTDLILPDGEGMGTVQKMRAAIGDAPLVVMTGDGFFASRDLMSIACSMGADAGLSKPFHPARAVALISELLCPQRPELAA